MLATKWASQLKMDNTCLLIQKFTNNLPEQQNDWTESNNAAKINLIRTGAIICNIQYT